MDTFRILLHGPKTEKPFRVPITTILNIPTPATKATVDIDPASIEFPKGKTATP